jgi:uncharacterized RDD family membrane protein YckC
MEPSVSPPIEYLRSGFGRRFLAYAIDILIMLTLAVAVGIIIVAAKITVPQFIVDELTDLFQLYNALGIDAGAIRFMETMFGGMFLGSLVLGVLYPLIEGFTGASPGKRILDICVATPDGYQATVQTLLRRYVVKDLGKIMQLLSFVPTLGLLNGISSLYDLIFIVGCFFVIGTNRMALHDMIAQTAVFHKLDVQSRS